jgi:hypothetical protein
MAEEEERVENGGGRERELESESKEEVKESGKKTKRVRDE